MRVEITFEGDAVGAERATAQVNDALKKLIRVATEAGVSLGDVKITSGQASETALNARRMQDSISGIGREADQTRRKLEELKLSGRTGVGVGPFGSGFGRIGLLGAAIGGGALVSGPAGAGALAGLAAIPGLATTGAAAIGVLMLSFNGLGKAIGGNKKAFDDLTPAAQQFTQTLRGMEPFVDKLKQTAGQGLFPGLTAGLSAALSPANTQALQQGIEGVAHSLGDVGQEFGKSIGSPQFTLGFGQVMQGAAANVRTLGDAGLHLAGALGKLTVTAGPLTQWMAHEIDLGARVIDSFTGQAQASGALAHWLDQARQELQIVARFFGALADAVFSLARALTPLGNQILVQVTRALQNLAHWVDQNRQSISDFTLGALRGLEDVLKVVWPMVLHLAAALIQVVHAMGGWEPAFAIVLSGILAKMLLGVVTNIALIIPAAAGAAAATASAAGAMVISWESVQGALVAVVGEEAAVGAGALAAAGSVSVLSGALLALGGAYGVMKLGQWAGSGLHGLNSSNLSGADPNAKPGDPTGDNANWTDAQWNQYFANHGQGRKGQTFVNGQWQTTGGGVFGGLSGTHVGAVVTKAQLAAIGSLNAGGGGGGGGAAPPFTSGLGGGGGSAASRAALAAAISSGLSGAGTLGVPGGLLQVTHGLVSLGAPSLTSRSSLIRARGQVASVLGLLGSDPTRVAAAPTVDQTSKHLADLRAKLGPEIRSIAKMLVDPFITPSDHAALVAQLTQYKNTITKGLDAVKTAVAANKQQFQQVFQQLGQNAISALQDEASKWQSPAQLLIDQLTSAHDDAALKDQLAAAQQNLADALVGTPDNSAILDNIRAILGRQNLANAVDQVQSAILGGPHQQISGDSLLAQLTAAATGGATTADPTAVAAAQKQVVEAQYQITIAGLTKTAAAETTAHEDQLQANIQLIQNLENAWGFYFDQLHGNIGAIGKFWADTLAAMGLPGVAAAVAADTGDAAAAAAGLPVINGVQWTAAAEAAAQAVQLAQTIALKGGYGPGGPPQLHAAGGTFLARRPTMLTSRDMVGDAGPELVKIGAAAEDPEIHIHGNIPEDWFAVELRKNGRVMSTTLGKRTAGRLKTQAF